MLTSNSKVGLRGQFVRFVFKRTSQLELNGSVYLMAESWFMILILFCVRVCDGVSFFFFIVKINRLLVTLITVW